MEKINETNNSRSSSSGSNRNSKEQQRPQVGVADYFAILGVGEELIWKHAQQSILKTEQHNISNVPEEDDALLLERFYREIVDVKIMTAEDYSNNNATTLLYHQTKQHYGVLPNESVYLPFCDRH